MMLLLFKGILDRPRKYQKIEISENLCVKLIIVFDVLHYNKPQ